MSRKQSDTPEVRSSGRKRVPSLRVIEAEGDMIVKREPTRPLKKPKVKVEEKKEHVSSPVAKAKPKIKKVKTPKPKTLKPKSPKEKVRAEKAEAEPSSDAPAKSSMKPIKTKIPSASSPYILVILVHVDRQGNSTEFWTAPKAKITKEQLEKLAACHHGALNDDEDQFRDIFALLVRHFQQLDEIFFEKPDIKPVKINQFISEVYQMHFGDFGANGATTSSYEEPAYNNY